VTATFVTAALKVAAFVDPAVVPATVGGWAVRIGLPVAGLVSSLITGS
jgi:hypothetical protein